MRKYFLLLLFFCGTYITQAQTVSIKGALQDTSARTFLKYAVIQLLQAKDSIQVSFARSDAAGRFELKNIKHGNYLVLITYPGYAEYADILEVKKEEDLGQITMITKAVALQNVIVRGGGAVRMKGDTTAFMADSFKVREGANVEDLLKRLPGFTVNKKGEITAQGEKIEKVLVDGEEFFGDDPTMATQNLQAKDVKEVQLFDKKSDQATFTGVDDGQKTKTLNLKLKDDAKKGYFGKARLAAGPPNRWDNSAMINSFKVKRKISAFGQMSNTGRTGLNWEEERSYGGANIEMTDDGGMYFNGGGGDDFGGGGGSFYGQGVPRSWNAGVNFGNKWNEDKSNFNGNYRYQKLNTDGRTNTITQYILPSPDTSYNINELSEFHTSRFRHRARGTYDITLDSFNSLRIMADGSTGETNSINVYSRQTVSATGALINEQNRSTNSHMKNQSFNSSGLWRKKFKKLRRTLSINFSQNYNASEGNNFLKSNERYFKAGQIVKDTLTDQMKVSDNKSLTLDSRIAYTEPISKKSTVEVSYGYNARNSSNAVKSFDIENGKYQKLNVITSNDFRFHTQTHSVGAGYAFNDKKVKFGFGGNVARAMWNQDNLIKDTSRKYNFTNFFPRGNFVYQISKQSSLRLNYNGSSRAPSLDQLQPIVNNIDPLNIALGNPDLKQSFNHRFQLSYNDYHVLTERGTWANVSFSPTSNAFSTSDRIDSGRRYYQTVNVSGNYNLNGYISYFFKWKKPEMNVSFNLDGSNFRNSNFINSKFNTTASHNYGFGIDVSKDKEKKYNVRLGTRINRNFSQSSVQPDLATRYWSGNLQGDISIDLPGDLIISTDGDFDWRQRTRVFDRNNNVFLWNAKIEKKIFKKKTATIGINVYDILNNNKGFQRDINSNYIRERNYDIVKRYALLSFTWNFSKNGKAPEGW